MNLLLVLVIFINSFLWSKIVWPPPPEKARIEYVKAIERPEDFGIRKSLWEKIKNFLFGEKKETRLIKPTAVYADNNILAITDQGLHSLLIFDLKKNEVKIVGDFASPIDVDFDGNRLLVSDSIQGKVILVSKEGKKLGTFGEEILTRPTGLVVDRTNRKIYVSDTLKNKIFVFSFEGKKIGEIESNFNRPTYINLDKNGNLYVSDSLNAKIRIFNTEGKEIFSFGERGNTIGTFANPRGIAVDRDGHIYISDTLFSVIQIFDKKGRLLLVVGKYGKKEGDFAMPMDIFIRDDFIYVADSYNARIVILKYLGGD